MFDFMGFDSGSSEFHQTSSPYLPEATDCMRCGVCLSVCPTFKLSNDEKQGPRQRVNSLRRLLQQHQELDDDARRNLESCVQCRACENVCPSKMDYAKLFDRAGEQLNKEKPINLRARLAFVLLEHKRVLNALLPFVKLYQQSGLRWLFRKLKLVDWLGLKQADAMAASPCLNPLHTHYPVLHPKGSVALFTGCISDRFDRETLHASIQVLNRIGFDVFVPQRQVCCGAIHYHNGRPQTAQTMMRQNVDAFGEFSLDAIIYCATGCGSQLHDYQEILTESDSQIISFSDRLIEITEFVAKYWPDDLKLSFCPNKIRVHEPCSQHNVLKNQQWLYRLLAHIADADISELDDNHLCCGAGGSYMLTHPDNAAALAALKWQSLEEDKADYLLTANIGCALHLSNAYSALKDVKVLHPIGLIAALLDRADAA
jgi:glycolate dehydrogenase iron-sulfur subunit